MKKIHANLLLLLVAVIWGGGFVFVEMLLQAGMSAGLITAFRGLIFSVLCFALYFKHIVRMKLKDVKIGLIAGATNALGFLLQTIGQSYASASSTSLITMMYVVFVPLVGWIFYKAKPNSKTYISLLLCVLGALLLVDFSGERLSTELLGDVLVLISAVLFGANMAILGHSGKDTHYGVVSFFMAISLFAISSVYTLVSGQTSLPTGNLGLSILSILYLGVLSSALCQIVQVLCQRHTSPESASLILMLEGFFGGVFSVLYGDKFTVNLLIGGLLIMLAVFIQEADVRSLIKKLFKKRE